MKLLTALLFVLLAAFQIVAQTVMDAEIFELVMPRLQEKTRVPVKLPIYLATENETKPLYAIVEEASPSRYQLQIAFTPNCSGAKDCRYGMVSGQELTAKLDPPHGQVVDLAQSLTGYFVEADCGPGCTDSTVSWDQDGYRYTVGIRGAKVETLRTVASSVTGNAFLFTKNAWKRTCFLEIKLKQENSETEITNAAAIAVNKDKKIYNSKMRGRIPVLTRLPEGAYEITVAKPGFESEVHNLLVQCDANERALELAVRLKPRVSNSAVRIKTIESGIVNSAAVSLPAAQYPAGARAVKASGKVNVRVLIDEKGNVVSATAVSGHSLLREAAEEAARRAKFKPILLRGQIVKVSGLIVYNFVP